jgi:dolichyl-phosphate-mannose-protein mannosyltransferase
MKLRTIFEKRGAFVYVALILALGFIIFVSNRGDPAHLFWDENYHVTSAERYIVGVAHFEPHPPLGLMLIAAGEQLSGGNRKVNKEALVRDKQISGDNLPAGFSFSGMRLAPSVFAAFGAVAFFGLIRELLGNNLQSALFTSLYLFENAFVVHFRAVHLEGIQIFFVICAFWVFVRYWRKASSLQWRHYFSLAVICSLAALVKINSILLFLMLPLLYWRNARVMKHRRLMGLLSDASAKASAALGAITLTVAAVFFVHIALTDRFPRGDTSAGFQDQGHMSKEYIEFLKAENKIIFPSTIWTVAKDYWKFMDESHSSSPKLDVNKPGENGSHPLRWPLQQETINYRWDSADGKTSYVQLLGNAVSWTIGTLAVALSILLIVSHRVLRVQSSNPQSRTYQLLEAFTALYIFATLLNLYFISQRVMYLYHYFLCLTISYVLTVLLWKLLCESQPRIDRFKHPILIGITCLIGMSFIFFLPLTNHWPMTTEECELRNSIAHVVDCN